MDFRTMTVGETAAKEPKAITIFKELGIDFCCDGRVGLSDALRRKNTSPEQFAEKLEKLKTKPGEGPAMNFLDMKPESLADYIVVTHHEYLRKTLPETHALFLKVLRVHGARHPELFEVFKLFGNIKTDLEQHLIKEETMLFPRIADRGAAEVGRLTAEIENEHEDVGGLLERIRAANDDYALPPDACMSYANLYQVMQELEDDIHQHVHLENNILFIKIEPIGRHISVNTFFL